MRKELLPFGTINFSNEDGDLTAPRQVNSRRTLRDRIHSILYLHGACR